VVVVRQEQRTTLTLANDFEGDLTDFALIVPVPNVLSDGDVSVVNPEVINRIQAYSAPRLVSYSCEDFTQDSSVSSTDANGSSGTNGTTGSATVEAQFSVGEYEIVVLSADQSGGLLSWLLQNGYSASTDAAELLQEYIDAGSYFLAAKVDPADLPDGQTWLRPLQISYSTNKASLPIRLGTLNSPGVQDLLVYILNDEEQGAAGISNYDEVEIEHECLVELADLGTGTDFGDFWEDTFESARTASPGAKWAREYAWAPAWCDPCAGDPLTDEDVQALGFDGSSWDAFFTRLHLRYESSQINQDLVLYNTNDQTRTQIRYILYDPALEDLYPICGSGWADDPGSCFPETSTVDTDPSQDEPDKGRFGCSVAYPPAMMAVAIALCGLLGRRED
jgi:hypothetical protein